MLVPAIFDTIAKTLGLSHDMTGRYSVFQIWRNRHSASLFKYDEYIYRGFNSIAAFKYQLNLYLQKSVALKSIIPNAK